MSVSETLVSGVHTLSHSLARAFPVPELVLPRSAGVDISDASIKWLVLKRSADGCAVEAFGEEPIAAGVVVNGTIQDVAALSAVLMRIKQKMHGVAYAHAALPEEPAYIFQMTIPSGTPRDQVLQLIEFEFEGRVPIPPQAAVYDFDLIERIGADEEIGVVVFPREVSQNYVSAFKGAGLTLLSLEVESRSIGRAVCRGLQQVSLLVDFGRARTGFAVLKNGIPIFSSTEEVGGETIDQALRRTLHLTGAQLIEFKNEQGLDAKDAAHAAGMEAVVNTASALADEITKHFHYWDTRRDEHGERMTPVSQVVLVGGSANLKGLSDYVAGRVQAPVSLGDVWGNIGSFDVGSLPIDRRTSLQYATAIGLALRAFV